MAETIWEQLRDTLSGEIADGRYPPGGRLPSEAALALRFGVNRHTVRRAIADMATTGTVHSRRGAGVFVNVRPLEYRLGKRTRFTQNLASSGRQAQRSILRLETVAASGEEAVALGLATGAAVHIFECIGSSDDVPLSYGASTFPAEGLANFTADLRECMSVTKALAAAGISDYRRERTRISAEPAPRDIARHLRLSEGAPVLRTETLNVTESGRPIEMGRTWFAADRVELLVDAEEFA